MAADKLYREAFERAKADLAKAWARKEAAEREAGIAGEEMVHLRRTVTALAALCGENVEDSMGLTEAVRTVAPAGSWFTLKMFKTQVEAIGVTLEDLKNPDASVLSVLSRLHASGELQTGKTKDNVRIWRKAQTEAPVEPPGDDDIPF